MWQFETPIIASRSSTFKLKCQTQDRHLSFPLNFYRTSRSHRNLSNHKTHFVSSYLTDPQYQLKFSIAWTSVLGFFVLKSFPRVTQAVKGGRGIYRPNNWAGIKENSHWDGKDHRSTIGVSRFAELLVFRYLGGGIFGRLSGLLHLVIPRTNLNIGQSELFYLSAILS